MALLNADEFEAEMLKMTPAEQEAAKKNVKANEARARQLEADRRARDASPVQERSDVTVGAAGELVTGADGKQLVGKHTGLHYEGTGSDGKKFSDVYGPRKNQQRMDRPAGGGSTLIRQS